MMLRRFHPLSFLLVLLALCVSVVALARRYGVEAGARRVGLVLDYAQFRTVVGATGGPGLAGGDAEALRRFKAVGITGMAVTEETLADLEAGGAVEVRVTPGPAGQRRCLVETQDPKLAERLSTYVPRLVRSATEREPDGDCVVLPGFGGGHIYIPGRFEDVRLAPTGLDEAVVRRVQAAGLDVVGRLNNSLGLTPDSLRWELEQVRRLGIGTVVFAGEEVLGFKGLIDQTAQDFRELGLLYGYVEMGKQRGDDLLARKLEDRLVRVHSISSAEMPRLTPPEAIERYVRAAAERNIRLNYVRLPASVSENTFEDSVAYVDRLAGEVARARFGLAAPRPFGRVWPDTLAGRIPGALIGLGVGAAALMLLAGILPLSRHRQAPLILAASGFCALLALAAGTRGQQAVALLASIVFPTLAFVLLPQPAGAFAEEGAHPALRKRGTGLGAVLAEFGALSAVTLAGALLIAGLLSELPFMVKTQSFAGIKLATIVPILLVGWIYLTGMHGFYPTWEAEREAMGARLREFFSEPVRVGHTVLGLVGLAALALLVARSGNDPGVGVSDTELRFRSLLDRILGARPRTKEFLIGHPALLLGLAWAAVAPWRRWALPLLVAGIIGQVGMLNSFCHLHTSLKLSVLHTVHGLWLGGLIGLALIWAWGRLAGVRSGRRGSRA